MVVFWTITKPTNLLEHVAIFLKASGDDVGNNVVPIIVVIWQVFIVAVATVRGHQIVPSAMLLWD